MELLEKDKESIIEDELTKTGSAFFSDPSLYMSVVGALEYATITRPNLAYAANKVCQFISHPLKTH